MPTEKPRITITLEQETYDKIEDFRFANRCSTLSKAINDLIRVGLMEWERTKDIPPAEEHFDPLDKMDELMETLAKMKEEMSKKREGK